MDGSWIAELMKRVVSLDDLEASEEVEASKAPREAEPAAALPEPPPKRQAAEITNHFAMQRKFVLEGSPHTFWKRTFSKPTFCNYCTEFIWGLAEQGFSCEVCGYAVHTGCLKDSEEAIHKTCRITNLEWIFWGLPPPAEHVDLSRKLLALGSPFDIHHWVTGINSISAKCMYCAKNLTSFSLDAQRCSRCKVTAHDKCIMAAQGPQKCTPPQSLLLYHPRPSVVQYMPLIVFINTKSGGQQGEQILRKFKRILGPQQAYNLMTHKPEAILAKWKSIPSVRVLACGGDGTVAWILQALDKVDWHPPVGILPLGTGNDLSRTLGWGPGYEGERIHEILSRIAQSNVVSLDRWVIKLTPTLPGPADDPKLSESVVKIINNYFSIGVDAKIAHDFHTFRESKPELCASRVGNKLWYALSGVRAMFEPTNASLASHIVLEADGKRITIGDDIQGLIVLNVLTYAGGADLWGEPGAGFVQPRINDGMLEVVGITGSFHMGTITAKLSSAVHITQARCLRIVWLGSHTLPVQTDGEPWVQSPCVITIDRLNQATMLCNGSPSANSTQPVNPQSPSFAIESFFDEQQESDAGAVSDDGHVSS